jgi:hypothetical protein
MNNTFIRLSQPDAIPAMLTACLRSSDELTCYLGKQLAAYSDMPLTATHAAHTYSQSRVKARCASLATRGFWSEHNLSYQPLPCRMPERQGQLGKQLTTVAPVMPVKRHINGQAASHIDQRAAGQLCPHL